MYLLPFLFLFHLFLRRLIRFHPHTLPSRYDLSLVFFFCTRFIRLDTACFDPVTSSADCYLPLTANATMGLGEKRFLFLFSNVFLTIGQTSSSFDRQQDRTLTHFCFSFIASCLRKCKAGLLSVLMWYSVVLDPRTGLGSCLFVKSKRYYTTCIF